LFPNEVNSANNNKNFLLLQNLSTALPSPTPSPRRVAGLSVQNLIGEIFHLPIQTAGCLADAVKPSWGLFKKLFDSVELASSHSNYEKTIFYF